MAIEIDHLILSVNDRSRSIAFYTDVLAFEREADDGPFSVLRVSPGFVLLISPSGTEGGVHLAFSMSKAEFDAALQRIVSAGVAYGDRFDSVGSMRGPADETGARGMGKALYLFDPDHHLIEIRHYETAAVETPANVR